MTSESGAMRDSKSRVSTRMSDAAEMSGTNADLSDSERQERVG